MSGTTQGMVQISAADLKHQRDLLALYDKVWNDPDAGETVRRTSKKYAPNLSIPDEHPVVVAARKEVGTLAEKVTGLEAILTEFKTRSEQERSEAALRKQLGEVQDKFRLTDDGMAKTIEIMQQRQLADPEAAALLYRESLPKTPPVSATSRIFDTKADMFGTTFQDAKWEKLHTDEPGFFADVVAEVFAEIPV